MFLLLGFAGELVTAVCVSVATTLAVKTAEDWHENRKKQRRRGAKKVTHPRKDRRGGIRGVTGSAA